MAPLDVKKPFKIKINPKDFKLPPKSDVDLANETYDVLKIALDEASNGNYERLRKLLGIIIRSDGPGMNPDGLGVYLLTSHIKSACQDLRNFTEKMENLAQLTQKNL